MLKKLKLTSIVLGAAYAVTCLSIFSLQKKLIYKPVLLHPDNDSVNIMPEKIYNSKGTLLALDFQPPITQHTFIIFHGRDRNAGYRGYFNNIFPHSRLLVIEYPGFGENSHHALNKKNILKHCHEAIDHILSTIDGPFTIVGESLGSGIAAEIAHNYHFEKLILITPYSTLAEVAQNKYWYLPTKTLLRDNYDSIKNLQYYSGHVLFVISEHDMLIPAKFGKKLLHSFHGHKKEIFVLNASHYNWWSKMTNYQKNLFKQFYEIT